MKKALIMFLIVIGTGFLTANAQLQRGNVLVGGDIANFDLSLDKGGNFSFQLDPKAAWFVENNIAIGAYLNFGLSTAKGAGTNVSYGVGALGRYYFTRNEIDVLRSARVFLEANAGIEGYNPSIGDNTNGLGLGFGPGIAYFITSNIGLEGLLKYSGIIGFGSTPTSNRLLLNIGFQIYLPNRTVRNAVERAK